MAKKERKNKKKKNKAVDEGSISAGGDVALCVNQVSRSFRTLLSRELSGVGLYAGQEGVLLALAERDGLTAGAIAQELGVKPPTMTRTIVRMEAQGFVERRDGDDGRLTTVWITQTGRNSLQSITAATANVQAAALAGLSDKQQRNLLKYLAIVDENLSATLASC